MIFCQQPGNENSFPIKCMCVFVCLWGGRGGLTWTGWYLPDSYTTVKGHEKAGDSISEEVYASKKNIQFPLLGKTGHTVMYEFGWSR